jgi:hypothetical protein
MSRSERPGPVSVAAIAERSPSASLADVLVWAVKTGYVVPGMKPLKNHITSERIAMGK